MQHHVTKQAQYANQSPGNILREDNKTQLKQATETRQPGPDARRKLIDTDRVAFWGWAGGVCVCVWGGFILRTERLRTNDMINKKCDVQPRDFQ